MSYTQIANICVYGITKWIKVWRKNKWHTKAGRAVKNIDLWVAISEELKQHGPIEWVWVKAHNGHPENERCDALAKAAAITGAKIADVGFQNPTISDDVTANTDTDEPQTNLVSGQANIVIKTFCPPDKVTKAAYAARIIYNNQQNDFSAVYKDTTTNRIELLAILDALTNIEDNQSVFVFTCSQYLQQGVTLWLNNWVANNWKTHNKKAVKNKDLWLRIFSEANRVKLSCYYLGNQLHHIQSDCANLARQAFNTSAPILDGASVQSL